MEFTTFSLFSSRDFVRMSLENLSETQGIGTGYSQTPELSSESSFLCLLSCISVRDISSNRLLTRDKLSSLRLFVPTNTAGKAYIRCDVVDQVSINLGTNRDRPNGITVKIISGTDKSAVSIQIPTSKPGCQYSYFKLEALNLTLCMVHDVVSVHSQSDLFTEEQDFGYTCLEIQEDLFLLDNTSVSIVNHTIEQRSPDLPAHSEIDQFQLNDELRVMNSLIAKYEQTRSSNTSTVTAGFNKNSMVSSFN